MSTTCPRCGHVRQAGDQAPDWECPACGIVYSKFKATEEQPGTVKHPVRAESRQPLGFDSVTGIAAMVTGVLAVIKGLSTGLSMIHGLLLVPFFFCLVPVLSMTFGDGLYQWNRWNMQFERFDSESRPLLAKIIYVFCIVFSIIFLVFFFKLHK